MKICKNLSMHSTKTSTNVYIKIFFNVLDICVYYNVMYYNYIHLRLTLFVSFSHHARPLCKRTSEVIMESAISLFLIVLQQY